MEPDSVDRQLLSTLQQTTDYSNHQLQSALYRTKERNGSWWKSGSTPVLVQPFLSTSKDSAVVLDQDPDQIQGEATVYSESESKLQPLELDSDVAKTVNDQYRKIINSKGRPSNAKMSDRDSIRTEDIEKEFNKTIMQQQMVQHQRHQQPPRVKVRKMTSDKESIKTEDFENQFRTMIVKQVGGVPVSSFDQMLIDSDLDTVKSHMVREKLRAVLDILDKEDGKEPEYEEESQVDEYEDDPVWNNNGVVPKAEKTYSYRYNGLGEDEIQMEKESSSVRRELESRSSNPSRSWGQEGAMTWQQGQRLAKIRLEMKTMEGQIKENRRKAEEARTELLLAEFKRDSARKELEQVLQQIHSKRSQLRTMEEHEENQHQQQVASNNKEKQQLQLQIQQHEQQVCQLTENNKTLELRIATLTSQIEAEQLESRQKLQTVKQEVSIGEEKVQELQNMQLKLTAELEAERGHVTSIQSECDDLKRQNDKMEQLYRQMEKDKNQLIKEKSQELETYRTRMQEQLVQARAQGAQEVHEIRVQLESVQTQLDLVNTEHDEAIVRLSSSTEEINHLKVKLKEIEHDKETKLLQLMKEREDEVRHMQKQHEQEVQQLQQQHEEVVQHMENKMRDNIGELENELQDKERQVQDLHQRLITQQRSSARELEQSRADAQERFVALLGDERAEWERENEAEVKQLMDRLKNEMETRASALKDEIKVVQEERSRAQQEVIQLQQQLEEVKETSRQMYRDKLQSLTEAKEQAEEQKYKEIQTLKEKLAEVTKFTTVPVWQDNQRNTERMREAQRQLDLEMTAVKSEKIEMERKLKSKDEEIDEIKKTTQEECRKLQQLIGGARTWGGAKLSKCVQQVKELVQQMNGELEHTREQSLKDRRDKSAALEEQRRRFQDEKLQALESLKDRLIKEHLEEVDRLTQSLSRDQSVSRTLKQKDRELKEIQTNLSQWKEQTSSKMAAKFHDELARHVQQRSREYSQLEREWAREKAGLQREVQRLHREIARLTSLGYGVTANGCSTKTEVLAPRVTKDEPRLSYQKVG